MKRNIRWRRKDSIFFRTMLMLSLLSLITLTAMFFFVTMIVTGNQRSRMQQAHEAQLRQAAVYVDAEILAIEHSNGQILRANDAISLMVTPRQRNSDTGYRVVSSLKTAADQNELVKNKFLYLPTTEEVYSSVGNFLSIEDSEHRTEVQQYLKERENGRTPGAESTSRLLFSGGRMYIVTDFCVPVFIGALFAEVDLTALSQQIQIRAEGGEDPFFLFDNEGNLILADSSLRDETEAVIAAGSYRRMEETGTSSGEGAGQNYLVRQSDLYGISYGIHTDPGEERVRPLTVLKVLLPFLLVYAAFSLLYSLNITQRIYGPINRLMEITESEQQNLRRMPAEKGTNELEFLEEAFQSTLGENRRHKELLAEVTQDVLRQTFRDVLNGTLTETDSVIRRMKSLGLSAWTGGTAMAVAGKIVPEGNRELSTVEEGLYRKSLLTILEECRREDLLLVDFFLGADYVAVLLCLPQGEADAAIAAEANVLTDQVRGQLSRLPYTVVFGKGKICHDMVQLRQSWQEALEEVQYRNYLNQTPRQDWEERPGRPEDADSLHFRKRAQDLADLAEKEKMEEAEAAVRTITGELCAVETGRRAALLESITDTLAERMISMHVTQEEIRDMMLGQTIAKISTMPDSAEESEGIRNLLMSVTKAIHTNSRKNRFRYVDAAKEYIAAHYSDGNLSLNEVSEAVGISAPYLSAVFAEISKGGFSTYLSNYRVETAKRFLEETSQNVAEIGYKCGFNSAQSFSRVFKKVVGLAPGQYRDKYLRQAGGTGESTI